MKRGRLEPRKIVNDKLTKNELKVFSAYGRYKTAKEIAEQAGLSVQTTLRHLATLELYANDNEGVQE